MRSRIQHAARFALPTLVTVLVVAAAYEAIEVALGHQDASAVGTDLAVWAMIAAVMSIVVFSLRLSDVIARPPSWTFAWVESLWVAIATVLAVHAVSRDRPVTALAIALGAMLGWIAVHRRIPGWPGAANGGASGGATGAANAAATAAHGARDAERDLP